MEKKCRSCAMQIPAAAKVCPYCRKKQGWALAAKMGGLILGVTALVSYWSSVNNGPAATPPASAPSDTPSAAASTASRAPVKTTDEAAAWAAMPASAHIAAAQALLKRQREVEAWARAMRAGKSVKAPVSALVTKKEWADVKTRLGLIAQGQPEYAHAQSLLRAMAEDDRKQAAEVSKEDAAVRIAARKSFAKDLEQRLLDARMDVDVTASGPRDDALTIKWVLANKVTANDFAKSGLPEKAERAGFKRMVLTDGYGVTWTWNLHPKPD